MVDFNVKSTFSTQKILALAKQDTIQVGYVDGQPHAGSAESVAEIARKLNFGYAGKVQWKKKKRLQRSDDEILNAALSGKPIARNYTEEVTYEVQGIPARPFLDDGIENGMDEILPAIEQHFRNIVNAPDFTTQAQRDPKGLARIGAIAVGKVKEWVFSDPYSEDLPNSPQTIESKSSPGKESAIPLIDTAQMINATTYLVNGKES